MADPASDNSQVFGGDGERRSWTRAMGRGLRKRCPECGNGAIFDRFTRTAAACSDCALDYSGHQADDAPPYLTILIIGHIMIPLALATKQIFDPPLGLQFAIWAPAMIAAMFWLLPMMKGAMIALQWANRMHGFAGDDDLSGAGATPDGPRLT